tara:strand:+ start:824 stop:2839 length:2016 start_codon:yes stop_codon:yes gene_type:complete
MYAKLNIPSGVFADRTDYAAGPAWVASEKIRFQQGLPEKLGGWVGEINWSFTGTPSEAIAWRTLSGASCLAVGTDKKLEIIYNDVKYDITPARATATLSGAFATVSGSPTVTVTDVSHGAVDQDYVLFSGVTAVGGITPDGEYTLTIVDSNSYTITHSSNASSTASGGGASIATTYLISVGSDTSTTGLGWGSSSWGTSRTGDIEDTATPNAITKANPGVVTTAAAHGFSVGDAIRHSDVVGMTEVNGVRYVIGATTFSTTTYDIGVDSSAFTTYTSGGTATKLYGWGYSANEDASDVSLEPDLWSLSLYGEDLIATRRNGGMYQWDASTGAGNRAAAITNAPTNAKLSLVNPDVQHVISFGSDNDPLKVSWASQETTTTWAAAAGNSAGSHILNAGTSIVSAVHTRGQVLIFTDDVVFAMNWQGPPSIFGFRALGSGCAPISQHSVVDQNGIVYWIGNKHFYMFDGAVKILESPVRDHVFDNMDPAATLTTYAGINRKFTEIWWLYAYTGSTVPNRYVAFNYSTGDWHFGTLDRTVFLDEQSWLTNPVAFSSGGSLYYHEEGVDDDASAMTASLESGAFEIPEAGESLLLMDRFIPDGSFTGTLNLTIYSSKYPNQTETSKGPYAITSSTEKIALRVRGRQIRFKLESSEIGDTWKYGVPRIRLRTDGRG